MNSLAELKSIIFKGLCLAALLSVVPVANAAAPAANLRPAAAQPLPSWGVLKGIVRDDGGNPIAEATVAIFRLGTSKLLKQVTSAADGTFIARIVPGTYTVLAVAQGFNPATLSQVEISGATAELNYGFKLERAGGGNTLPEKRLDRNSPKWVLRSAQTSRSIYQNSESATPVAGEANNTNGEIAAAEPAAERAARPGQTVVESYFAASNSGTYSAFNFATLIPLKGGAEIVLAGQTGFGANAPQRLETRLKVSAAANHQLRFGGAVGKLGRLAGTNKTLGQISLQAADEWRVRDGVIVVFGLDYARFIGAGSDFSVAPRLGLQLDLNSKTRFRSSFTAPTDPRTWSRAIELEDSQIAFADPTAIDDIVSVDAAPKMNKSTRLEFGIERVLDNRSSVEANFFLDTTLARGIGLTAMPFDAAGGSGLSDFVGDQSGGAQGARLVYARRVTSRLSASAGYSIGRGQSLSPRAITNPGELFRQSIFQTFFGQLEADLRSGTNVKTILRLSPAATVFAIDPFQGRLAIYDPGLSIVVTQNLPTLGLPFQAEAVVDARNLFDFQTGIATDDGALRLNSQGRAVRGGILVRF